MSYLLDNNLLSYFWNSGNQEELRVASTKLGFMIVGEVRDEFLDKARPVAPQRRAWLPKTGIKILEIAVGSPEHKTLNALLPPGKVAKGLGERASIAIAAEHPELVFVSNDSKALWMALRELHSEKSRILGIPVFLRRLHESGAISTAAMSSVLTWSKHSEPTWWASYVTTASPKAGG